MAPAKKAKTAEEIKLTVVKRDLTGKKVKQLRTEGKLPANIFGKDFTSTAITVDAKDFALTLRKAGETQVIHVSLDKKDLPVMIANVQMDPITGDPIHADFKKIDLTKKVEADVPIKIIGESEAVEQHIGDLLTLRDVVTVEALPANVPSEIEVDISGLTEIDQAIHVKDLKLPTGVELADDPEALVAKIAEHKEEEVAPELPEEGEAPEGAEEEAPADEPSESPAEDKASESSEESAKEEAAE